MAMDGLIVIGGGTFRLWIASNIYAYLIHLFYPRKREKKKKEKKRNGTFEDHFY